MKNLLMIVVAGAVGFAVSLWFVDRTPGVNKPQVSKINVVNRASVDAESNMAADSYSQTGLPSLSTIVSRGSEFEQTAELYSVTAAADFDGLKELLSEAATLDVVQDRGVAMHVVLSRMGEVAPAAALALVERNYPLQKRHLSETIWRAWAMADFDAALRYSQNHVTGPDRVTLVDSFYRSVGLDDEQKRQAIESAFDIEPSVSVTAEALSLLAQTSVSDAISDLNKLSTDNNANYVARVLGRVAARYHGATALDYKSLVTVNTARQVYASNVYIELASADPVNFIREFGALTYSKELAFGINSAFKLILAASLPDALEVWDGINEPKYRSVLVKEPLTWTLPICQVNIE